MVQTDNLIHKWQFLLEEIDVNKSNQYKFARIYEQSSLMNDFDDFKLIASILYKVFTAVDGVYLSKSKKNKIEISRIEEDTLFDFGKIMIDGFLYFATQCAEIISKKIQSEELQKINYLRIDHENNFVVVTIIY